MRAVLVARLLLEVKWILRLQLLLRQLHIAIDLRKQGRRRELPFLQEHFWHLLLRSKLLWLYGWVAVLRAVHFRKQYEEMH